MKEFLEKRIYIITFIFGLGGGVLSHLLNIREISSINLTSLAVIFSFIISLFISLLLKRKWTAKTKTTVTAISFGLLILSVYLAFNYFNQFDDLTFTYTEGYTIDSTGQSIEANSITHLKGCWYTENANNARKKEKKLNLGYDIGDSALIRDYFGGLDGVGFIWDREAMKCAKRKMVISYSLLVLFLSATISLLTEVLYTKYKQH